MNKQFRVYSENQVMFQSFGRFKKLLLSDEMLAFNKYSKLIRRKNYNSEQFPGALELWQQKASIKSAEKYERYQSPINILLTNGRLLHHIVNDDVMPILKEECSLFCSTFYIPSSPLELLHFYFYFYKNILSTDSSLLVYTENFYTCTNRF